MQTARVVTHTHADRSAPALERLIRMAARTRVTLLFDRDETAKHRLRRQAGVVFDPPRTGREPDVCIALGGDGTTLRALRMALPYGAPVFPINVGRVGFLASADEADMDLALERLFAGAAELVALPVLEVHDGRRTMLAINDLSLGGGPGGAPSTLALAVSGVSLATITCDAAIVATATGSTGYSLANGAPPIAWGVGGMAVSFLAARLEGWPPLVVAAGDRVELESRSRDGVMVETDGRPAGRLSCGEGVVAALGRHHARLLRLAGDSFYARLRLKFGPLAGRG